MNKLIDGLKSKDTLTANGATTNSSSLSDSLDFFFLAGASRKLSDKQIENLYIKAFAEDNAVALRILFWARDIRGGAGERRLFRVILNYIAKDDVELLHKLLPYVAEYGRWDDMLVDSVLKYAIPFIVNKIENYDKDKLGLLFKWLPREKSARSAQAKRIRLALRLSRKEYRKLLSENSSTIEQLISAGKWSEVKYSGVPSKAFSLYRTAFYKHDEERFEKFLESVKSGESKINAGAIFPSDLFRSWKSSQYGYGIRDGKAIDLQWEALPNYLEGNSERILCVCDTSGSMSGEPEEVSIALGVYLSERMGGAFKDHFITFEGKPKLQSLKGTATERFSQISRLDSDCGTNLVGVFELLLSVAKRDNLSQDDLPTKLLIISDMEFNSVGGNKTNLERIKELYSEAGYTPPGLIFWNVNGRPGNSQAQIGDVDTALISGYSPSIVRSVLGGDDLTPRGVMIKTLNSERYDFINNLI